MRTFEQFISDMSHGVDFGPTRFELVWGSFDKRWVIVRKKGYRAWSGRGQRSYVPMRHYLLDLDTKGMGHGLWQTGKKMTHEGRFQKRDLELFEKRVCELRAATEVKEVVEPHDYKQRFLTASEERDRLAKQVVEIMQQRDDLRNAILEFKEAAEVVVLRAATMTSE